MTRRLALTVFWLPLLECQTVGEYSPEMAAIREIQLLHNAEVEFRSRFGQYGTIPELQSAQLIGAPDTDYVFTLTPKDSGCAIEA